MFYEVVGIEQVDYVNKAGKRVTGIRLYCMTDRKKVVGKATKEFYCNGDIAAHVNTGDIIRVFYNEFGNVEEIVNAE